MKGNDMFFQLLCGIHNDLRSGKRFTAGDIVPCDHDLVQAFGSNKFRRLSDKEVAQLQPADEGVASQTPLDDEAEADGQPRRKHHKKKARV